MSGNNANPKSKIQNPKSEGTFNLVVAGVGGQGVLLLSDVVATAALLEGFKSVTTYGDYGMAQRGGSVQAHIRFGDGHHSPLVGEGTAALLIGMELYESLRALPLLKGGGAVVANRSVIVPPTALSGSAAIPSVDDCLEALRSGAGKIHALDALRVARQCGAPRSANMVLLGAACGLGLVQLALEKVNAAVEEVLGPKRGAGALVAMEAGRRAV